MATVSAAIRGFDSFASSGSGFLGAVKGAVAKHLSVENFKTAIDATIGEAMRAQQQLFRIQSGMGNTEIGTAYFEHLSSEANKSAFDLEEFVGISRNFMQITKNTDSLDQMNKLSERLTLMDPTQGLEGAGFALKEAMEGDFSSLLQQFQFNERDAEILKSSNGMDDFISKFDSLLNQKGATEEMLEKYNKLPAVQLENLASNFKTALGDTGKNALDALTPLITGLNDAFSNGSFQTVFNGIGVGLDFVVGAGLKVIEVFQQIAQIVQERWTVIEPILIFIAGALLGMLIQNLWATVAALRMKVIALWSQVPALYAQAQAWLAVYGPIMMVFGAIALVIYILMQCGVTTQQIIGFIGGLFGVLFAHLYNHIAFLWNIFASFAEFLTNLFIDPVYAIRKLFYDVAISALNYVGNIAKGLQDLVKRITGIEVDFASGIENLANKLIEPTTDKKVLHINRMEQMDYSEAAGLGYKKGANIGSRIEDGINNIKAKLTSEKGTPGADFDLWNANQTDNFGMVNEGLKGVNDKLDINNESIDISNEKLELMRDLAEQEIINRFTTATLAPQINLEFGDIRETADVDGIVPHIEKVLTEQIVIAAEGVYE